MVTLSTFQQRRNRLRALLPEGLVVLGGHRPQPMNIPMNVTRLRQSSHLLFLTGLRAPDVALLFRLDTGRLELFLPPQEAGDDIWHGRSPSADEIGDEIGADAAYPLAELEARIASHRADRDPPLFTVPSADPEWAARLEAIGIQVPRFGALDRYVPSPLADALVTLRLSQDAAGLEAMRAAAAVTAEAHRVAMAATRPGGHEAQIRALIEGVFRASGMALAYDPIVTIRGEVLHCWSNPHRLSDSDLLLVDAGCETPGGYAADVTRTWPVRGRFDGRQRAVYEIVLEAQMQCIDLVRPGVEYVDIHLHAARVIAQGLKDLGLLRGSIDDLVANDTHALFFPHGVGHLIGLDVHDIEDLGDRAGYGADRQRSPRFGMAYLRLNRRLEPGMAVTIEPGIYFIPGLLENPNVIARHRPWVDFDKARSYLGFGGIRIEDDVVVTLEAPEVLSAGIPKTIAEIEACVGSAPELLGALGRYQPA